MVIFMPYYRQHGQLFHPHSRTRPSSTGQNNPPSPTSFDSCQIGTNIFCRFIFSLFLFLLGLFLFYISILNAPYQKEGKPIIAVILLTVAIISFIRTCQKLREYYIIMGTRRRLIQRLRERQQAYDLTLNENSEHVTDLPSYKTLFPSHPDISNCDHDSLSSLPPPSYDDYVKTLPHSHVLPLSNISSQLQTNSTRCIWITDRTRRPICMRGTVTYV